MQEGINVNFVEQMPDDDKILVRTYERAWKTKPCPAAQVSQPQLWFATTMSRV
jgi:diaminopimelate epimerase